MLSGAAVAVVAALLATCAERADASVFAHGRTAPAALASARAGDAARPPVGGARLWRVHDAERGWVYPPSCCSDYDCREVGGAETPHATIRVFERPEGYVISSTGEVIPMTSRKVRPSPDGVFHWCSVQGRDDGETICLFVPPRGF